jgi:hypothetical protein
LWEENKKKIYCIIKVRVNISYLHARVNSEVGFVCPLKGSSTKGWKRENLSCRRTKYFGVYCIFFFFSHALLCVKIRELCKRKIHFVLRESEILVYWVWVIFLHYNFLLHLWLVNFLVFASAYGWTSHWGNHVNSSVLAYDCFVLFIVIVVNCTSGIRAKVRYSDQWLQ